MQPRATLLTFAGLVGLTALAAAQEPADPYAGRIHKASDDPLRTLKRMQIPKGMQAELTAAEPLLANPIAFCFDHQGRIYVAESFRLHKGVPDNRGHMNWLDVELANRTVADRIAMYKKFKHYDKWGKEHDRIRKLWDADGNGKMDRASVFADGFKNPEDGLGSGVLRGTARSTTPAFPTSGCSRTPTATTAPTRRNPCTMGTASTSPSSATTCTG